LVVVEMPVVRQEWLEMPHLSARHLLLEQVGCSAKARLPAAHTIVVSTHHWARQGPRQEALCFRRSSRRQVEPSAAALAVVAGLAVQLQARVFSVVRLLALEALFLLAAAQELLVLADSLAAPPSSSNSTHHLVLLDSPVSPLCSNECRRFMPVTTLPR
jgi:hypothetical protein